jgi:hypothetical protein
MKTLADKLCALAGIIAQVGVGYCTWQAHWAFTRHWNEVLAGAPLPQITVISLAMLRFIPIAIAILIAIAFIIPILQKRIMWWTLLVTLFEVLIMALMLMGVSFPAMIINYRIGS